jgi:hypothetical protein
MFGPGDHNELNGRVVGGACAMQRKVNGKSGLDTNPHAKVIEVDE